AATPTGSPIAATATHRRVAADRATNICHGASVENATACAFCTSAADRDVAGDDRIYERKRVAIVDAAAESAPAAGGNRVAADNATNTRQRASNSIVKPAAEATIGAAGDGVSVHDTVGHVQGALIVDAPSAVGRDVPADKTALECQCRIILYAPANIGAAIIHGQTRYGDDGARLDMEDAKVRRGRASLDRQVGGPRSRND